MKNKPIPYRLTTDEERANLESEKRRKIQELIDIGLIIVEIQYQKQELIDMGLIVVEIQYQKEEEPVTVH